MINQAASTAKRYWERWAKKRNRLGNPQTLNSRNLYILPSKFGWAYALLLLIVFLGAINYQINTIYLMTFLLSIVGLISAWEAHSNLKNLSFQFITVEDAQCGTPAKVILFIKPHNKVRYSIEFQIASQFKTYLEKLPTEGQKFVVPIETQTRGYFQLPPLIISSLFPFGIFRVWSYLYFEENYYVYPEPIDPGFWPDSHINQNTNKKHASGDEEFYDLKQVENPWTNPNLIAWRIAAKGKGWYLKTMHGNETDYWLFKINDLPAKNLETKLQHLSYWLQNAESNGLIYALELKGSHTKFSRGKEHLQYCLRQLALYQ